eukprot:gene6927-48170_t
MFVPAVAAVTVVELGLTHRGKEKGAYRLLGMGMWDAEDGDVVVIVHRRTLLRWAHCPAPLAPGAHLPLHFVNLWFNFNCAELPHRVMLKSVWVWRRADWPQLWQWYGGSDAARAGGTRPLRELARFLPDGAASRLDDTYRPVHVCRPVCEGAGAARDPAACRTPVMAGYVPGMAGKAQRRKMPPCPKKRMDEWGMRTHKTWATAVVPSDDLIFSYNRDKRRLYETPQGA